MQETKDAMCRERSRHVQKAEAASGFKEGARIWNDRPAHVYVTFYGGDRWWIEQTPGEPKQLTAEIWAETRPLILD